MEYSELDASVRDAARRGELGKLLNDSSSSTTSMAQVVRRLSTARDSDGRTLLYDAVVGGNVEDCRRVLAMRDDENGTASDVNMRDGGGWSPLMSACSSNRPETARWLLESGAKPDANHRDVFYAASKGGAKLMEVLLEHGGGGWMRSLTSTTSSGKTTLLHRAVGAGNFEVCEWLVARMREAGVDVAVWAQEVRDGAGETVLDLLDDGIGGGMGGGMGGNSESRGERAAMLRKLLKLVDHEVE